MHRKSPFDCTHASKLSGTLVETRFGRTKHTDNVINVVDKTNQQKNNNENKVKMKMKKKKEKK